jgi:hypothetical protein
MGSEFVMEFVLVTKTLSTATSSIGNLALERRRYQ